MRRSKSFALKILDFVFLYKLTYINIYRSLRTYSYLYCYNLIIIHDSMFFNPCSSSARESVPSSLVSFLLKSLVS